MISDQLTVQISVDLWPLAQARWSLFFRISEQKLTTVLSACIVLSYRVLTSLWVSRLPGVSDLAAPVHLGEIYQAACPLVFPVKEYALDKGNVDVGVIDLERIKVLGAFVDKSEFARVRMQ